MKKNLFFSFIIDKSKKTVYIVKEYTAKKDLVWDAFTKQEILDQWWAPKPWKSKSKYMNFEDGGKRFYAMVNTEGEKYWSVQEYNSIIPQTSFKMLNAFADKDENRVLPGSDWDFIFSENNGITKVSITIYNESLERMEQQIEMGFQGGFTMTLIALEKILENSSQNSISNNN
ncbi:MAG: SRPBCC domain-containing protein [Flavobacterium sp.]|nr:SRPBCC domain-containing protein [Flavobacterium sp.]